MTEQINKAPGGATHKYTITDWYRETENGLYLWEGGWSRSHFNSMAEMAKTRAMGIAEAIPALPAKPAEDERHPQVEAEITDPFDPEFRQEPSLDATWFERGQLPPIGMTVRLLFKGDYAYDCEVVAVRGEYVVLWCADARMSEALKSEDCRFEPLQTERQRVASELVDVMMAVPVSELKTGSEHAMDMALAIYDHLHKEQEGAK